MKKFQKFSKKCSKKTIKLFHIQIYYVFEISAKILQINMCIVLEREKNDANVFNLGSFNNKANSSALESFNIAVVLSSI